MTRIHPIVAPTLPTVVALILAELNDKVDRIVLHGSSIDGGGFSLGTSDVDVAVLLRNGNAVSFEAMIEIDKQVKIKCPNKDWREIEINYMSADRVDRFRNFANCYEGSVAQGVVLFDCGRTDRCDALSDDEARKILAHAYLDQSWCWIAQAHPAFSTSPWSSARAACRALHAILVQCDYTVSPKAVRWHFDVLFDEACRCNPNIDTMSGVVSIMPAELAVSEWEHADMPSMSFMQRRQLVARAMRLIRVIEKIVGYKVSHPSRPHFRIKQLGIEDD